MVYGTAQTGHLLCGGGIHALLFVPSFIMGSNKKFQQEDIILKDKPLPKVSDVLHLVLTFVLVTMAWIFFRAVSLEQAFNILKRIFSNAKGNTLLFQTNDLLTYGLVMGIFFLLSLYFLFVKKQIITSANASRFVVCVFLLIIITLFGQFSEQSFIYFQF